MPQPFVPGDDLVFQLESGFGVLRVLALDEVEQHTIWHLRAYDEFFPDVDAAERALERGGSLPVRAAHLALTDRAFERTPTAKVGNHAVTNDELEACREWRANTERRVSDRSVLLLLGMR